MTTTDDKILLRLPYSKSMRSRYMIICAVAEKRMKAKNSCDDLTVLSESIVKIDHSRMKNRGLEISTDIRSKYITVDVRHSGTALRFLTAYAAAQPCAKIYLTGSERLCQRPIHHLVDTLKSMGADIEYVSEYGYAPLLIRGTKLRGGNITIPGNITSQYISALMLITPLLDSDLDIELTGDIVSRSYIQLSEKIMKACGASVSMEDNRIHIAKVPYQITRENRILNNERDWSAATPWLAAVAIAPNLKLSLPDINLRSYQPDAAIVDIFRKMGVSCTAISKTKGVNISNNAEYAKELTIDCITIPDAIPVIVVAACMLNIRLKITGARTLKLKECDRTQALVTELSKCGFNVQYDGEDSISFTPSLSTPHFEQTISFSSHNDHRIAMALSLIGLKHNIEIQDPDSVTKSYPQYWEHFAEIKNNII